MLKHGHKSTKSLRTLIFKGIAVYCSKKCVCFHDYVPYLVIDRLSKMHVKTWKLHAL